MDWEQVANYGGHTIYEALADGYTLNVLLQDLSHIKRTSVLISTPDTIVYEKDNTGLDLVVGKAEAIKALQTIKGNENS